MAAKSFRMSIECNDYTFYPYFDLNWSDDSALRAYL